MFKRCCRRRGESGAATVEFALVLVPFLVLVFGMLQYGFYFYSAQSGSHAANTVVRQLAVGNCHVPSELLTYTENTLGSAARPGTVQVTRSYLNADGTTPANPQPEKVTVGGTVEVSLRFKTINMNFPFLPFLNDESVVRTVDARVEDTNDQGCGS